MDFELVLHRPIETTPLLGMWLVDMGPVSWAKDLIQLDKPKTIPTASGCDMLLVLQWPGGIRYEQTISGCCDFCAD